MGYARQILAEALDVDQNSIGSDASSENMREWDSLAHIRLITMIEGQLGRSLSTEEILSMTSLNAIEDVLGAEVPGASSQ